MLSTPLPRTGDVVRVRRRTWLVNEVHPGTDRDFARVQLSCLDADAAGDPLEVLWQLELSTEIIPERPSLLGSVEKLDDPRMFGAYLNALRWDCVTSTNNRLLQAPFRAGIDLKAYQVEPLRKALELPRVNLFIADDVGLGKTIEAGLILQELILRQRVERVLVIAPPAVTMQWQEEMEQRFGLRFEIYNRDFITARRRERGWSVNPWTTAPRFIVSSALLRGSKASKRKGARPTDHLGLLLGSMDDRHPRTLLIMDEAHHAAPSSGSAYAIDSRTTRAIRQITKKFEHRLFLSATPHNGHSNSFSALLELLDPQRFTRGVKVRGVKQLEPVMVRRLKRDLRQEIGGLPERILVDHTIRQQASTPAIRLGVLLAQYETAYKASLKDRGLSDKEQLARGLVCINLHKRLLSSIWAFNHTLNQHARSIEAQLAAPVRQQRLPQAPTRALGENTSDEELDQAEDEFTTAASLRPSEAAMKILQEMKALASENREKPDDRLQALATWIRDNLCPDGTWGERKVVVFTEYDHTLSWINRQLPGLLGTYDLDRRIALYRGGMSDTTRNELKRAFNLSPGAHPLRVLLCTDAAREGINLQAHCTDLFHFDLPWNPARVEQRNGRIDRTLQPAEKVYCHYFVLPDRPEDKVLEYMVQKINTITEELGSLSDVLSAKLAKRMELGIRDLSTQDIDRAFKPTDRAAEAARELEGRYADDASRLRGDLGVLERQLESSQSSVGYNQDHLREAVDLGLTLATGGQGLASVQPPTSPPSWQLPALDRTWEPVLSPLRERLPDDAPRWKVAPVKPVAFRAAHRLDADTVQLHLGHPLVKRLLARFRAQGFAAHDLARVTVIEDATTRTRRVLVFGRLALYGGGATRLHEEIIAVGAQWSADSALTPYKRDANKSAAERLFAALAQGPALHPDPAVRETLRLSADRDFAALWPHLEAEAAAAEADARAALESRGQKEAEGMKELLIQQEKQIRETIEGHDQLKLGLDMRIDQEREQFERDRRSMEERLKAIVQELRVEPGLIAASYKVALRRFEPVGLVYLWPGA